MPPRHTKSNLRRTLSCWLGATNHRPRSFKQYTRLNCLTDLSRLETRIVYITVFTDVRLSKIPLGRWETNYGGEYFGAGVGGAITGRGAIFLSLMILFRTRCLSQQPWTCMGVVYFNHVSVYNLAVEVCDDRWSKRFNINLMRAMVKSRSMGRD